MMNDYMKQILRFCFALSIIFLLVGKWAPLYAQLKEPPVRAASNPVTPLKKGVKNRVGGGILLSNFGFGVSGTYAHVLAPFTELTFTTNITGIRYASQQSIINFSVFGGTRKIIPNKYNRALGFPFLFGIKQRIFPRQVSDNFRFFVAASGGPALSLVFPYINDADHNGYRSTAIQQTKYGNIRYFTERKRGFFAALGHASAHIGIAGSLKMGIDFGSKFKTQPTFEIGYFFYYFNPGLQIMDPKRPVYNNSGQVVGRTNFYGPKKYFGTPEITFKFSSWW
ncbi:MAG TPA: hypothetical protein VE868_09325 [Balneolaceae bacterium]|nr:hypothetical protein [Balneolaceae bacterium]